MGILHVHVAYRPIRIGWCLRRGRFEDLEEAFRLAHTLWGGRYNPVIVVDDAPASSIVNAFRLDALYPISRDDLTEAFISGFPYLRWPGIGKNLFEAGYTSFQDVSHALRRYREKSKNGSSSATLYTWDRADPLALVLLSSLGGYPSQEAIGADYGKILQNYLVLSGAVIKPNSPFPQYGIQELTPSFICSYDLVPGRLSGSPPGFYVGDAADFTDIVNFWNLRAANVDLAFYDPAYHERLSKLIQTYPQMVAMHQKVEKRSGAFAIISRATHEDPEGLSLSPDTKKYSYIADVDFMLSLASRAPIMSYGRAQSSLASVDDRGSRSLVSIQLPEKPFYDDSHFDIHRMVVSVYPGAETSESTETTAWTPFVPELNYYYSQAMSFAPEIDHARVELRGIGIIASQATEAVVIRKLPKWEVVAKIFEQFGMKADPSQPGRVAGRLITQMGGLRGCTVFKIAGVRALIQKYDPLHFFTRSEAVQVIGQNDAVTGRPRFEDYEQLKIAPGESGKLKPDRVFDYLLEKRVFRAGLSLVCPNCDLGFWKPLDELSADIPCEYCGAEFNITPQLRHRGDWTFRRSGLFGRPGHQEGSIPVALTLQQIDTHTRMRRSLLLPGMNVAPSFANVQPCETDLVILMQGPEGELQFAVGECKERGEITEQDVANLAGLAEAFPLDRVQSYIIFSKINEFTEKEICHCRKARVSQRSRVILLSGRDIEPEFAFIRDGTRSGIPTEGASLWDFAFATEVEYFED
ncbi:MAG TPA: hypothetical protein VMX16_19785 [Terriglobia bacterium]|nr:hypothetical protein [Terriglobia bacterium]